MAKARAGSSLDHVKQGSALLNQLMNLNKAGQNSSSGAGDSLARVGESITDKDPVSSAVSGLMSGIGAGMKVSEATANRKSMEGMEENIMELMRQNNEVAARNQQIEQEQAKSQKIENEVASALPLVLSNPSDTSAQSNYEPIVKLYNQLNNTNFVYKGVYENPQNGEKDYSQVMIGTADGDVEQKINLFSLIPDPDTRKFLLQNYGPNAVKEMARKERQTTINEKTAEANEKRADAYKQSVEQNSPDLKEWNKHYSELNKSAKQSNMFKDNATQALKMIEDGKVLFANNIFSEMGMKITTKFDSKQKAYNAIFDYLSSAPFLAELKNIYGARITDFDLKFTKALQMAETRNSEEASKYILNTIIKTADKHAEMLQKADTFLKENDYMPPQGAMTKFNKYLRDTSANPNVATNASGAGNMIKINGKLIDVNQLTAEQRQKLGV